MLGTFHWIGLSTQVVSPVFGVVVGQEGFWLLECLSLCLTLHFSVGCLELPSPVPPVVLLRSDVTTQAGEEG